MTHQNSVYSSSRLQTGAFVLKAVVTAMLFTWCTAQQLRPCRQRGGGRNFRRSIRQVDITSSSRRMNVRWSLATSGRYTPVTFEIAERKSSVVVTPARDSYVRGAGLLVTKPNLEVNVRQGDILLGRGKLDDCGGCLLISSTGLGFVSVHIVVYHEDGRLRGGDALAIVSNDGAVRHRKKLVDLFNEKEVGQFYYTMSMVVWYRGGWIDEKFGKRSSWLALWKGRAKKRPSPQRFQTLQVSRPARFKRVPRR